MAERVAQKSKRQTVQPRQAGRAAGRAAGGEAKRGGGSKIEVLERERDQLKAQLADAQAVIARLEKARDEAVNRIDWTIDSLHNLLESDA